MSTYSLSTTIKCTKGKNLASRTISDLFPYDSTKYATITSISRKDGIYCKTGSSSSSVWATFYVTAQLLIGGTAYITLDPIAGKSCGTGPSNENYVTTTFEGFTQEQSNALVAAWAAGTLSIQWTLSGSYGSNKPYFRDDGVYSDTISINGEDVVPVVYAPTVDLFTIARQSDTSTKADVAIKLSIDASADLNNARLKLFYAENDEPDTVSGTYLSLSAYIQRCVEAAETGYAISLTDDYALSSDWHFVLVFQIGDEQGKSAIRTLNRSSVPIHIAKSNTGVAIGGYSLPADGETRIDLYWPVYAHSGITEDGGTSKTISLEADTLLFGFMSNSKKDIYLSVPVPGMPSNAASVTVESIIGNVRCAGGYGAASAFVKSGTDYTSLVSAVTLCPSTKTVTITLTRSTAMNGTNNYALTFQVNELKMTIS